MNTVIIKEQPKLVRVSAYALPGGKIRYTGEFSDGSRRKLRESLRVYCEVAQIGAASGEPWSDGHIPQYREEFVFGAKHATVSKWQAQRLIATVNVGGACL